MLRRPLRLARFGLLGLFPLIAGAATMHNRLVRSAPEKDQVLTAAPTQIRLWFADPIQPRLAGITLLTPDSTRVPLGKVAATDTGVSVAATVPNPLPPGRYTVSWRSASEDGHVIRGRFDFTLHP